MPDFSPDFENADKTEQEEKAEENISAALSQEEKMVVKEKAKSFINNLYHNPDDVSIPRFAGDEKVRSFVPDEKKPEGRYINKALRETTEIFLKTLVNFFDIKISEAHLSDNKDQQIQKIDNLKHEIRKIFFSVSPNIANNLHTPDTILLAAKTRRVPGLHKPLGETLTGEAVYEMSFSSSRKEVLLEKIKDESTETVLNVIDQLRFLVNRGLGEGGWAEKSVREVTSTLKSIKNQHPSPLVVTKANQILESLRDRRPIFAAIADSPELVQEHFNLKQKYSLPEFGEGYYFSQIAEDALGVKYRDGRLRYVIPEPEKIVGIDNIPDSDVIPVRGLSDNYAVENPEEDFSLLMEELHDHEIRKKVEQDLDTKLSDLKIRSQIFLLKYLANQDRSEFGKLVSVVSEYEGNKASLLNSFLATEIDSNVNKAILDIARHENSRISEAIFAKFNEMTAQIDEIDLFLQKEFSADQKEELIDKITKQLLQKGRNVLVDYADKIQNEDTDAQTIIDELESIRTEDKLFLSTLKTLTETGQLPELEEVSNMNLSRINSERLESEQIEQMKAIYKKNYPTENYSQQFQESLLEKLDTLIANNSEFYLLDYKGEIKGFVAFLSKDNEMSNISVKQAASLNVDPDFQNHRIGQLMIDKALEQEAQSNVLVANSKAHSPLSGRYIEKGFVGVETFHEGGTELLDIVWDKKTNQSYRFKPMVEEEIIRLFTENQVQGAAEFSTGEKIKKVNSLADLNYIDLDEDKVLTRLFEYEDGWLAVFEPAPEKEYPESIK